MNRPRRSPSTPKPFGKPTIKKRDLQQNNEAKPFQQFRKESTPFSSRSNNDRKPYGEPKSYEDRPKRESSFGGERKPFGDRPNYNDRPKREGGFGGERKPFGERKSYDDRPKRDNDFGGERKPFGERKSYDDRPKRDNDFGGERKPFGERKSYDDRPKRDNDFGGERKPFGERKSYDDRPKRDNDFGGERKPFGERKSYDDRPKRDNDFGGERKPFGERKSYDDRPKRDNDFGGERKPFGERKSYDDRPKRDNDFGGERKPFGERKSYDDRPKRDSDFGGERKPFGERKSYDDRPKRENDRFSSKKNDKFAENSQKKPAFIGGQPSENKEEMRLNRYISNAGVCSRRDADELIKKGEITVNGEVVTEMGHKVKTTDVVKHGKKKLQAEKLIYVLLNKPKDYITTTEDPEERKTVMELVADACTERIYPVGRLDRNTTGLLLLTNDGELTEKLMHPSNSIKKVYQVEIDKKITTEHFEAIQAGLELEDGFIKPDGLGIITPDAEVVGIELHSGKNRIVRRIFEHLGYEVLKLDRTTYAGLNKKDLPRGKWRFLNDKEVIRLKYMI